MHMRIEKVVIVYALRKSNQLILRKNTQLTKELNAHKKKCTCKTLIDQRIFRTDRGVHF